MGEGCRGGYWRVGRDGGGARSVAGGAAWVPRNRWVSDSLDSGEVIERPLQLPVGDAKARRALGVETLVAVLTAAAREVRLRAFLCQRFFALPPDPHLGAKVLHQRHRDTWNEPD